MYAAWSATTSDEMQADEMSKIGIITAMAINTLSIREDRRRTIK